MIFVKVIYFQNRYINLFIINLVGPCREVSSIFIYDIQSQAVSVRPWNIKPFKTARAPDARQSQSLQSCSRCCDRNCSLAGSRRTLCSPRQYSTPLAFFTLQPGRAFRDDTRGPKVFVNKTGRASYLRPAPGPFSWWTIRNLVLQHNPVNTDFALDIIGPDVMRVQWQFGPPNNEYHSLTGNGHRAAGEGTDGEHPSDGWLLIGLRCQSVYPSTAVDVGQCAAGRGLHGNRQRLLENCCYTDGW